MQRQLIRIDSKLRVGGTIGEFTYNLAMPVQYSCCKVLSVEFPNTIYNISDQRQTTHIVINQNGTIIPFDLTEGNYSATQFALFLQTTLNAAVGSNGLYVVTYSINTAKFTISNAVNINILFPQSFDMYKILGFANANTGNALTHTSSGIGDMSGPSYMNIEITNLVSDVRIISGNGTSAIFSFPLTTGFGSIVYFEEEGLGFDELSHHGNISTIRAMQVTIQDDSGRIPTLYLDWSMLLEMY